MTKIISIMELFSRGTKQLLEILAAKFKLSQRYQIHPDITYLKIDNYELKLDLYQSLASPHNPTLIWIHPGGWINGQKKGEIGSFWPFLELGFSVVNIEYRLAHQSLAPAAVEDCLAALNWVIKNATLYGFNLNKIVVGGRSAGGHLALMTGMLSATADSEAFREFFHQNFKYETFIAFFNSVSRDAIERVSTEKRCKVAAIINVFGITDVQDLLDGANVREYARTWIGGQPNGREISQGVSPINYVCSDLPPILTIHGDADTIVPYSHAIQLHQALDKSAVSNQLLTIPGGGHGFSLLEKMKMYETIKEFLKKYDL